MPRSDVGHAASSRPKSSSKQAPTKKRKLVQLVQSPERSSEHSEHTDCSFPIKLSQPSQPSQPPIDGDRMQREVSTDGLDVGQVSSPLSVRTLLAKPYIDTACVAARIRKKLASALQSLRLLPFHRVLSASHARSVKLRPLDVCVGVIRKECQSQRRTARIEQLCAGIMVSEQVREDELLAMKLQEEEERVAKSTKLRCDPQRARALCCHESLARRTGRDL